MTPETISGFTVLLEMDLSDEELNKAMDLARKKWSKGSPKKKAKPSSRKKLLQESVESLVQEVKRDNPHLSESYIREYINAVI